MLAIPKAYGAHFVFLGDVWIRTQRAAEASRCATNLATHLPNNNNETYKTLMISMITRRIYLERWLKEISKTTDSLMNFFTFNLLIF